MPGFDQELRECLEVILEVDLPEPEYDAFLFYKHFLGGRNLGLVPVAAPGRFDWPGHWVARVRTLDGDHAVVMFGSPSGPLHDPADAIGGGGTIEEGWLLARLDVRLPIEAARDGELVGTVEAILVAPDAELPLVPVERVEAIAGKGLAGDRYHNGLGTFSGPGRGYQLTLVEAEALEAVDLSWEDARRNVVTRGIALNELVGRRFTIGVVECVGRRLAEPCAHLEKLSRPGILRPLVHRAGLRADILVGGPIATGDTIAASD